ncbi:recombinase family protein [Streptomyces muensis]|uniref:Recombinase family protein n=1 Tax=Streptomyces muensis TaxID=1077944 RepID=A0A9X1Q7A3_STRM4|nr:recombinase family protein [Streptomyces muensis]MCF1599933.1 recombinase family protein [Streptomyces muensis]
MTAHGRYVGVLRVSQDKSASTSVQRQRENIESYINASEFPGILVGWAEDTDVSGGLSPFNRPQLGKWLTRRVDEFDGIIAMNVDRLTRRALHFSRLHDWGRANGKRVICVSEGYDSENPQTKMKAQRAADFAEAELDAITDRIKGGVQGRLTNRSWVSGTPPMGYAIKSVPGQNRKILVRDPGYAQVMDRILQGFADGKTLNRIALELNEARVLTWSDYRLTLRGAEPRGAYWQQTTLANAVRRPTFAGIYTYKGEAVEDDDGNPILIAENPFMSFEDWSELAVRLEPQKREGKARQRISKHPLTGIALCGRCGSALGSTSVSQKHGRYHAYYRCSKRAKKGACEAKMNIRVSELEAIFDEVFDAAFSALEVTSATGDTYEGPGRRVPDIWADKDAQDRKAFLREHGVSVRVWQDLVPRAKYSAVIDFGDITGMAKAVGLRLPDGTDRLVIHYQCGEDDIPRAGGSPAPPAEHGRTDARKRGLLGAVTSPRQR